MASADDMPYVVRGNQHIVMGITLDEAAVRAALPEGLEPSEGMTGGLNVYRSQGGEGVPPYTRSYVWVDVNGYDSLTGNKGRYVFWIANEPGIEKLESLGLNAVVGQTALQQDGNRVTGLTTVGGAEVMKVTIELGEARCDRGVGTVNYPSFPAGPDEIVVTQYAYAADFCGATPVAVEIPEDSPLTKFKPATMEWAVLAKDLSFAASPPLPQQVVGNE
jgi:hypothetical protein